MGGIMGRLFHEFAVVISVAILISGVVALSLSPMLASRLLKSERETKHHALYRATERAFDAFRDAYGWSLRGVLRHRYATLAVAAGTLVATVYLYGFVPKGFIPSQDIGLLQGSTEGPQDISFEAMAKMQRQVADVIASDPNIEAYTSNIGAGGFGGSMNAGRLNIRLKPRHERDATPEQIIDGLRPRLNAIPGIRTYLQNPPLVRIGGMSSRSLYQFTLQGPEIDALYRTGADFERRMRTVPGLVDVTSDLQLNNPQVTVHIDREMASRLNVTAEERAYLERRLAELETRARVGLGRSGF